MTEQEQESNLEVAYWHGTTSDLTIMINKVPWTLKLPQNSTIENINFYAEALKKTASDIKEKHEQNLEQEQQEVVEVE